MNPKEETQKKGKIRSVLKRGRKFYLDPQSEFQTFLLTSLLPFLRFSTVLPTIRAETISTWDTRTTSINPSISVITITT
jgi:hypothetical protein